MKLNNKIAALEALLFIHGEPLDDRKIEKVLGLKAGEAEELLGEFQKELDDEKRGLCLVTDSNKHQLTTKAEFGGILEKFIKDELSEDLTPASLEALSVIAYLGPISRSRIEYLRGVNSQFTLRNLMLRGLIDREPDPKRPNVYLYRPSVELVKHLGLGRAEELPDYDKFRKSIEDIEKGTINVQQSA